MNLFIQKLFFCLQIFMANLKNSPTNLSFDAPVESPKINTPSKKCLYLRVPHPDQVPNFQFEEIPTYVALEEKETEGHFVDVSNCRPDDWSNSKVNKSYSEDFTETDWIEWVNHVQFLPGYEVSDNYEDFSIDNPSSLTNKFGVSYSLYNVACAGKMLFAFSHLSFSILHGSIPFKNFCWSCETLLLDAIIGIEAKKCLCKALIQISTVLELYKKIQPILQTADNLLEAHEDAKKQGLEIVDFFDRFVSNDLPMITADDASNDQLKVCFDNFRLLAKHQVDFLNSQEVVLSKMQLPKKTLEGEMACCNKFWKDLHADVTFKLMK